MQQLVNEEIKIRRGRWDRINRIDEASVTHSAKLCIPTVCDQGELME